MCGIAGILTTRGEAPGAGAVRAMVRAIGHRGPDDESVVPLGALILGHRRLSILDPTPAGNQPMVSSDGRYWIVHNGEIYNFLELAEELAAHGHAFRTGTDTEVILAAYREWGLGCLERLEGIWAFALWDAEAQQLVLSRDRFGVKPLYVAERDGRISFASEIKGLLTLPWVARDVDAGIVHDFLLRGLVDHSTRTFFSHVRALAPGTAMALDADGGRRETTYWRPGRFSTDAGDAPRDDDRSRVEEIRARIVDAVAFQLRTDVPIGSCLSGGIDSSTIVATAAGLRVGTLRPRSGHRERDGNPQLAFFAEFRGPGIDERRFVDEVVAATGVELRAVTPTVQDLAATLTDIVRLQDEPFGSLSIVAQYHVMRTARDAGVKVLLDGQGADELFGGYAHHRAARDAGALRSLQPRALAAAGRHPRTAVRSAWMAMAGARPRPRATLRSAPLAGLVGPGLRDGEPVHVPAPDQGTVLGRLLWRDVVSTSLPALLRYEDRNSMAFGIEARVPFLDHRLVEAVIALPDRLRIQDDLTKVALRRAAAGITPEAVLARRDKIAFAPPQETWLRSLGPMVDDLISASRAEARGLLRPGALREARGWFEAGRIPADAHWRVLSVELWLRMVVEAPD